MAQQRLGEPLFFLVVKSQLHGVVTVGFDRFGLNDAIGANQDDSHRHYYAASVIDAGLTEFFSE
jgi:hypothetical protein